MRHEPKDNTMIQNDGYDRAIPRETPAVDRLRALPIKRTALSVLGALLLALAAGAVYVYIFDFSYSAAVLGAGAFLAAYFAYTRLSRDKNRVRVLVVSAVVTATVIALAEYAGLAYSQYNAINAEFSSLGAPDRVTLSEAAGMIPDLAASDSFFFASIVRDVLLALGAAGASAIAVSVMKEDKKPAAADGERASDADADGERPE